MQNHGINVHAKAGVTLTPSRVVVSDGMAPNRLGDSALHVIVGSANVTRANGNKPVGILEGNPANSHIADAPGGARPVKCVVAGPTKCVAAVEFDPANAAHQYFTFTADGRATPTAHDGGNWIVGRFTGTRVVPAGYEIPCVVEIR